MKTPRKIVPHPTDATLALVPMTKGYFAVISVVDSAAVGAFNWHAHDTRYGIYAARTLPGRTGTEYLHAFVAQASGLALTGEIDHRDGNKLDCRRSNLRPATHGQNACNAKLRSDSTSGVKGVHFEAWTGKWRAEIKFNGRHLRLGRFDDLAAAEAAVVAARVAEHGDFANHGGEA